MKYWRLKKAEIFSGISGYKWLNDWVVSWVLICMVHLTVRSYHVMYAFQSESTLYSFLNVKELLARNRHKIWSLSDCNWTRTQNHWYHFHLPLDPVHLRSKWLLVWVPLQLLKLQILHLYWARSSLTFRQI